MIVNTPNPDDSDLVADSGDRMLHKARSTLRGIAPYARRRRGLFLKGALAAIGIVAARLALPWPLREIARLASDGGGLSGLSLSMNGEIMRLSLMFLGCIAILGFLDYMARLYFSRFSISTTRDLRQAAFSATLGIDAASRKSATGDLVSRLIGDAARVKAGMQGFLLHVATNGLLFIGVTIVLFVIEPDMGMLFAVAAIATTMLTLWGAHRMFRVSLHHRRREGQLANKIHSSLRKTHKKSTLKRINKSSGRYEASLTRLQGRITWATHAIFGVTVVGSMWIGIHAFAHGRIAVADLVLFMFYALMVSGPLVRLARQGTRTGKILGPAYRLVQMLQPPADSETTEPALRLKSLKKSVTLKQVLPVVDAGPIVGASWAAIDLKLKRGQCVAIVDASGVYSRQFVEVLAGQRGSNGGSITWDSAVLKGRNTRALAKQVVLIRPDSSGKRSMAPLAARFRDIAKAAQRRSSIRVYLEPDDGLGPADCEQVLSCLADSSGDDATLIIVTTRQGLNLGPFDRVIHFDSGQVLFDGSSSDWVLSSNSSSCLSLPITTVSGQNR